MGKDLIGKTEIDLEDRFYSMCYAVCGLSDTYEQTGYNSWRDQFLPSEILKRMCKKWNLKPPVFEENSLFVYTVDDDEMIYVSEDSLEENNITNRDKLKDYELESKIKISTKENLALRALKDWRNISLVKLFPYLNVLIFI